MNRIRARYNQGCGRCSQQKTCNISEMGQDMTKDTIDDQQEVAYALSIGAKINNLGWPWRAIMHFVSPTRPDYYILKVERSRSRSQQGQIFEWVVAGWGIHVDIWAFKYLLACKFVTFYFR